MIPSQVARDLGIDGDTLGRWLREQETRLLRHRQQLPQQSSRACAARTSSAAVAFRLRGGLIMALVVILLYLPHVLGMGETLPGGIVDNLLELPVFLLVGGLVGSLADRERAQRRRAERLGTYIDAVLQSLPLGVATAPADGTPTLQNLVARELLPAVAADVSLVSLGPGYHSHRLARGTRGTPARSPTA